MCCFGWHVLFFFFFKQKTAYEMRISDWSSDVCSSDLAVQPREHPRPPDAPAVEQHLGIAVGAEACALGLKLGADLAKIVDLAVVGNGDPLVEALHRLRSEEHTSELQSLMRISYAVFCLKKKKIKTHHECAQRLNLST